MQRFIIAILTVVFFPDANSQPAGQWLAAVPYSSLTYRMYLESQTLPRLINVSFKANEIPMDTIYFDKDRLHFSFKEFYTTFNGQYDAKANRISGIWITEDKVRIAVTFEPVNGDTVLGLHPRNSKTYTYKPPPQQPDQWAVSSLSDQHVNREYTDSLTYAIMNGQYPDVHSLLIARNDSLVYEEYFYSFHTNSRQNIQSVTKSFVSTLTGIALYNGEIKSVHETLCSSLSSHQKLACNAQNKSITLHHLLSMSTGLKWDEATYDYGDEKNSAAIAGKRRDPVAYLLSQPRSPSPVFSYNSMNHSLMNAVLQKTTKMKNSKEITTRLLTPLGIESFYLGKPVNGVLGDIELRPRDMMKLGQLYLQKGKWNGKQIVPAQWIQESTSTKIVLKEGLGYGYFWWTKQFNWKGKPIQSFFAWGYGGQYIFVVPEFRLVVAMTGSHWTTNPETHAFEMMEKFILPACE